MILVLADHDGVVVLPREKAEEIITNCEKRYAIEKKVGNMVNRKASVFDAVEKYKNILSEKKRELESYLKSYRGSDEEL